MNDLIRSLLTMSSVASVISLVLFIIKPLMRNRLSKSFQYYIWLVTTVLLLVPIQLNLPTAAPVNNSANQPVIQNFTSIRDTVDRYVVTTNELIERTYAEGAAPSQMLVQDAKISSPFSIWLNIAVIAWPLGAVIFMLVNIIGYLRFCYTLKKRNIMAPAEETTMLRQLCPKRIPPLFRNPAAATPMLIGIFRPLIVLPDREYDATQFRNILLHELTHLGRGDVAIKWLMTLANAIHWFNPVVYFARREMCRACELSCDEAVIKRLDRDGKQSYGDTLISVVAESKTPFGVLSTTMCEEKKTLKERLEAIMKYKPKSKTIIAVSVALLVILSVSALALGARVAASKTEMLLANEALEQLKRSVISSAAGVSFEIPINYAPASDWNIIIAGRWESADGFSASAHFFEEINNTHSWEPGKRYDIDTVGKGYTELIMSASLIGKDGTPIEVNINLLDSTQGKSVTRESLSMILPANLSQYQFREDSGDDFSLWSGEINIGGLELLTAEGLDQINHAILISQKDLPELAGQANMRLYERDYPAASGRADSYRELHISLLYGDIWYDFWLDLRYGSEDDLLELVKSVQFGEIARFEMTASPDGKYYIEANGVNTSITAGGLFPAEEIRIRSAESDEILWRMEPGYYKQTFLWSPDSRYVSVYYMARTWGGALVVDTEDMSEHPLPGPKELAPYFPEAVPDENRPDPYIEPIYWAYWENEHTVFVECSWVSPYVTNETNEFFCRYLYDVSSGLLSDVVEVEGRMAVPKYLTYEVQASLHEGMPEYRFVANGYMTHTGDWGPGYVLGLEGFDENGSSILSADFSEIDDGKVIGNYVYNQMMDTMGLHVVDVNFDGFRDVIILRDFGGAHSNTWYYCWLWNEKTASFVASKSFAEICNPALDPEKQCIYSAGGSGAAYWGGRIYQFIDGEFVVTNDLDTGERRLVETKLVNGAMEVVRDVNYNNNEKEKEYYKTSELWQLDHPRWYWYGGHHADQWLDY